MSVDTTDQDQVRSAKCEAHAYLRKAAEESVFYVALGKCLRRELAEKFGLPEERVGGILSCVAVELVDRIRAL